MITVDDFTSLDTFLEEEGFKDEVDASVMKRVLALELEDAMREATITKTEMARRMATSRAQLDRILDKNGLGLTLETMVKAANAVGRRLELKLV